MIQPQKKTNRFEKYVEHFLWKGMKPFPALTSDFSRGAAELIDRRENTCERLRSQRGLRPYEEIAERPSVYVERLRY